MKIEYLLKKKSSWLDGSGLESDIVLSSRVRLARNLKGFHFAVRSTPETARKAAAEILAAAEEVEELKDALIVEINDISPLDRQFLIERRLVSRELASGDVGVVVIGKKESISLMINEEDHLRIQVLQSGLSLSRCWEIADRIDSLLEQRLDYEYCPEHGYLTACPTNMGTGMRASAMIHLPALVMDNQVSKILQAVGKLGLAVRGIYGEGTRAFGNIFQISNQQTLGRGEEEIIGNLERIIIKIINHERQARHEMLENSRLKLEDRVFRALGILQNARLLTAEETINLLSALRMGVNLNTISGLSPGTVNEIFIHSQPAHLQKMAGNELSSRERDILRAKIVRDKLSGLETL